MHQTVSMPFPAFVLHTFSALSINAPMWCSQQRNALALQVQVLQSKQEEHQKLLAEQETQLRALGTKLKTQSDAKTASEQQLQETKDWHQLEQQTQHVESLTEQLSQAQTQVSQLQCEKAQSQQQLAAEKASAAEAALSAPELKTQLSKAQAESASMADAQKQLQQQLGERTILLGQKAHQIALLAAQLNEAGSPTFGETSQGQNSLPYHQYGACHSYISLAAQRSVAFNAHTHTHTHCQVYAIFMTT